MKQNQEDPKNRFVTSHRWKGKSIIEGPQPFWVFFRKDLQGRGMLGFPENLDQADCGADEKNGKGYILKTKSGDQMVKAKDRVPFLIVSHTHEKSPYIAETGEMFRIGSENKDTTVTSYAVPKNGNSERCCTETEMKLKGLKHYAEFLEKGGTPDRYSKIQMI